MPSQPEFLDSVEHLGHFGHQYSAIGSAPGNKPAIEAELGIGWSFKPGTQHHGLLRGIALPHANANHRIARVKAMGQPLPPGAYLTDAANKVARVPATRNLVKFYPWLSRWCTRATARWHPGKRCPRRLCSEPAASRAIGRFEG